MSINRRQFLQAALAAGASAPFVRFSSLMPMVKRTPTGLSYIVFDNVQLYPFHNRIPSFEFELENWSDYRRGVRDAEQIVFGKVRAPVEIAYANRIQENMRRVQSDDGSEESIYYSYSVPRVAYGPVDAEVLRVWADGEPVDPAMLNMHRIKRREELYA